MTTDHVFLYSEVLDRGGCGFIYIDHLGSGFTCVNVTLIWLWRLEKKAEYKLADGRLLRGRFRHQSDPNFVKPCILKYSLDHLVSEYFLICTTEPEIIVSTWLWEIFSCSCSIVLPCLTRSGSVQGFTIKPFPVCENAILETWEQPFSDSQAL